VSTPDVATSPWVAARRRAETLRDRHPFAAEVLTLYLGLLDVWAESPAPPEDPEALAGWAAEHVLPRVVATTVKLGPEPLAGRLLDAAVAHDLREAGEGLLRAWLSGADLDPVERYLARAALRGPLEEVDAGAACARDPYAGDPAVAAGRRCPRCAGPPQLSFRTDAGDHLVSGRRRLLCARCGHGWDFSGSTCAGCGETAGDKRTIYSERRAGPQVGRGGQHDEEMALQFPHLRIEGCESCARYLIDVDLGRDPRAVPEVDELAALPLDLYAAERGISKIMPNLMGF
jgi:FdhE protein